MELMFFFLFNFQGFFCSLFASAVLTATSCLLIIICTDFGAAYIFGLITNAILLLAETLAISIVCYDICCNSCPQQQVSLPRKIDNEQISQALLTKLCYNINRLGLSTLPISLTSLLQ